LRWTSRPDQTSSTYSIGTAPVSPGKQWPDDRCICEGHWYLLIYHPQPYPEGRPHPIMRREPKCLQCPVPSNAICPHLSRKSYIHSIYNGADCPCDDALNPLFSQPSSAQPSVGSDKPTDHSSGPFIALFYRLGVLWALHAAHISQVAPQVTPQTPFGAGCQAHNCRALTVVNA
jgi:hypothetical protein